MSKTFNSKRVQADYIFWEWILGWMYGNIAAAYMFKLNSLVILVQLAFRLLLFLASGGFRISSEDDVFRVFSSSVFIKAIRTTSAFLNRYISSGLCFPFSKLNKLNWAAQRLIAALLLADDMPICVTMPAMEIARASHYLCSQPFAMQKMPRFMGWFGTWNPILPCFPLFTFGLIVSIH